MGWKRIVVGIWIIGSLAWVNYAVLQEVLYPTGWENVFFDPWFWFLWVGIPSAALALFLKGVVSAVTGVQDARKSRRRRRLSRLHHHGERHGERHEPSLAKPSFDAAPPGRRPEPARPHALPRTPR